MPYISSIKNEVLFQQKEICHHDSLVTHFLQYFYTGSSGVPNFPEFVVVGMVDEVEIIHYDNNTRRAVPKQDWMKKVTENNTQYWNTETKALNNTLQVFRNNIETAKQRFNQTQGIHVFQLMYGYFIIFDLNTETWIAPKEQAVITKHKWDHDADWNTQTKHYLTQDCIEWLQKYVYYGRHSLKRTVLPSVFLLQKSSSSPVFCHATGFHPNRAEMVWRKDGVELHEGVNKGEILPNNDGTFQMSVDLDLSSTKPEDWRRYDCVFQISGVSKDFIIKLDKAVIKTNQKGKMGIRGNKDQKPMFSLQSFGSCICVIYINKQDHNDIWEYDSKY
uniref:Ig-like domain-containing protein n=1 Tax=Oreochromis niloticus TaxID=8128 RepID=I3JNX5_ORENI